MMNVPIGGEGKGCQWSWMGVQKCLFRQGGALGRGTTCFHVRRAVSQGDQEWNDSTALQRGTFKDYVVKMTFRNRSRRVGEQEFFEKANAAGDVPGLAKFISSSRVAKFDIIEDVRKGVSGTTGRGVSFDDLDDLWNGGVDAPTGKEETQGQVDPCGIDRVLTLLVLGTVGTPVREAATPIQLLHGIFACLLAHATLYFESGILHRDISYQNILFTSRPYPITRAIPSIHGLPPMAPSVLYGCLIDLDYATHYHPSESLGETKHRTGTLPFMAVEILTTAGIKHRYVHDVQSFMLVLVWCCVDVNGPGAMGPKGEVTEAQKLAAKRIYKWNEMDRGEEDVGSRKELDLVKDERWGEILAGFRSGFELGGAMARLAGGLRDLLFPVMERHGQKPVRSQADFDEGEEELGLFTAVRDLVWEALRELADGEQQASG